VPRSESEESSLRERWAALGRFDIKKALDRGERPFGDTAEGLKDYQGIVISTPLNQIDMSGVDFSFGRVGESGQLGGKIRVLGCKFRHFVGNGTISGEFLRCDFGAADLSSAVIMGRFETCGFDGAKLVGIRASQATFKDCSFRQANLAKASCFDCRFTLCNFDESRWISGSVAGSVFEECTFPNAVFRKIVTARSTGLPAEVVSSS
jgi:uncharacterized protein YjbI with pentapeptide repeats